MTAACDVLFITLDSCRFDAFEAARAPHLKAIGPLIRAWSPSHFTYGAHAAFFMGFTPGDPSRRNLCQFQIRKIFRLTSGGHRERPLLARTRGRNIIDGFAARLPRARHRRGRLVRSATDTGRALTAISILLLHRGAGFRGQCAWLLDQAREAGAGSPVFAFANLGETHVPYWHDGAAWDLL
jgi:hypothetical protein